MKLVIQIPAFNEAGQLPATLQQLPRTLAGVSSIEWLVIDDGSDDDTANAALRAGADHVVRLPAHRGLAYAFLMGLEESLRRGADVIVNTDADNQYQAADMEALVRPVLDGHADLVVGARPIDSMGNFSAIKKWLQRFGTHVVRTVAGVTVDDATSGFRAYSRDTALSLDVFSRYTYTLETLIQAGQSGLRVVSVPVRVNAPTRPSRLARNSAHYVWQATITIVRAFVIYRPFRFFIVPALAATIVGVALGLRFLYAYVAEPSAGHVQSLILAAILILGGGLMAAVALVADLLSINRRLLQRMQTHARRVAWAKR